MNDHNNAANVFIYANDFDLLEATHSNSQLLIESDQDLVSTASNKTNTNRTTSTAKYNCTSQENAPKSKRIKHHHNMSLGGVSIGHSNGKKTKGRVKIKMEYIENKVRRYTTFSKRKTGIMKKAYELSTLTGTQVMLLVASETGHVYTFATEKLKPIITSEAGKSLIQSCLNDFDEYDSSANNKISIENFEDEYLNESDKDELEEEEIEEGEDDEEDECEEEGNEEFYDCDNFNEQEAILSEHNTIDQDHSKLLESINSIYQNICSSESQQAGFNSINNEANEISFIEKTQDTNKNEITEKRAKTKSNKNADDAEQSKSSTSKRKSKAKKPKKPPSKKIDEILRENDLIVLANAVNDPKSSFQVNDVNLSEINLLSNQAQPTASNSFIEKNSSSEGTILINHNVTNNSLNNSINQFNTANLQFAIPVTVTNVIPTAINLDVNQLNNINF